MGSLGPAEILVILLVALIVLGPERLPDAARQAGRIIGEIRRIGAGFQAELRDAMSEVSEASPQATAPMASADTSGEVPAPGAPPGPSADVAPHVPAPPPARPPADDQLP